MTFYEYMRQSAERGELVVLAAGHTVHGTSIAFLTIELDEQGETTATHDDKGVRVAQMLGAMSIIRTAAARHGFIPA